ncbi:hypothetical protein BH23BAC1_BH23BAC1_19010 [soil metagenome]
MNQEALRIYRENGSIVLNGKQKYILGNIKNELLLKKMTESMPEVKNQFFILIYDIAQLYDYVVKIPEIAWDIVDFAEKPISVIYPQGKNIPEVLLMENGKIMIQLVKSEMLKNLLKTGGKGAFAVALPDGFEISKILSGQIISNDFLDFGKGKIMQMELNGEIRFFPKSS